MGKGYIVYKFRLYPTDTQKVQIDKTIGCCRFIYNWALGYRDDLYKEKGEFISEYDLNKKVKDLKKEYSFLKEADSIALLSAVKNNSDAFDNFFKKRGKHPIRRKKTTVGSYETQLHTNYYNRINEGKIVLPKLGEVKIRAHRYVDINTVKNYVTVSRNTIGEYYLSIKVLVDTKEEPTCEANLDNTIGVDLGVRDLAICDDGTKFGKFKIDRRTLKRKKRLQRRIAKKVGNKKGEKKSNNYIKLTRKIAKIDLGIVRKREKYEYKVVNDIVAKESTYIAIEDLNVKGMKSKGGNRKKGINGGFNNAALGKFKIMLTNKAKAMGKKTVEIDRWYPSSKTCHKCGYINKELTLKNRDWTCPVCGEYHDRDINGAINIKSKGVETLNQSHLSGCTGKVKSVESETKQKTKNQTVFSISALDESENSNQIVTQSCINQQFTNNLLS